MKVCEWHTQLGWWVAGIFATGALWYFLSVKNYCIAAVSAVLAVAFAVVTILLHKIRDGREATDSRANASISYEQRGRFGRNLLSGSVHEVTVGEAVSMQADVPKGSHVHVVLSGLPAIYLEDGNAGWSFPIIGVLNWANSTYQDNANGGEQHFDAIPGPAEMEISFSRPGKLAVKCFEHHAAEPTWTKIVSVNAA